MECVCLSVGFLGGVNGEESKSEEEIKGRGKDVVGEGGGDTG